MRVITLLLLGLTGCAEAKMSVPKDFEPEFNRFMDQARVRKVKIPKDRIDNLAIKFTVIDEKTEWGSVVGKCTFVDGMRVVTIDQAYWTKLAAIDKEVLLYHELGHCLLNRDHVEEKTAIGWPMSIMYPQLIPAVIYYNSSAVREAYVDELFLNADLQA